MMDSIRHGTLYGIGVGPGEPDLLTLRAAEILGRVDVVFAASSSKNEYSRSRDIAAPHLRPEAEVRNLGFPMTRDKDVLEQTWEQHGAAIASVLDSGRDAAFLTLGDPLLYSTFGYVLHRLKSVRPDLAVEIVPGITSFQAAAAKTHTVLAEAGQNLVLLPGIRDRAGLEQTLEAADNCVILKAYRNFEAIRDTLRQEGRDREAVVVSRLGAPEESVRALEQVRDTPHYLTLVLVPNNGRAGAKNSGTT